MRFYLIGPLDLIRNLKREILDLICGGKEKPVYERGEYFLLKEATTYQDRRVFQGKKQNCLEREGPPKERDAHRENSHGQSMEEGTQQNS